MKSLCNRIKFFLNSYGTEKESTSKRGQKTEVRLTSLWERSVVPTAFTIISLWTWSNLQKRGGEGRCTYQYNIWTRVTKLCQHPSNPIGRNPHSSVCMASGWSDPLWSSSRVPQAHPVIHSGAQDSTCISVSLPYTASGRRRYYDFLFQREKKKTESELHKTGTPWCLHLKSNLYKRAEDWEGRETTPCRGKRKLICEIT